MKPNTRHNAKREISIQLQQLHEDREQGIEELEERLQYFDDWDYCEWHRSEQHDNPRLLGSSERGPVGSGPRQHSGGGFVLDSGECRSAGQGGLWQSSERAGPMLDLTDFRNGSISAPDAADGSLTRRSKPIT